MSHLHKKKDFHFNLFVLIRWTIFALIIYFAINYLSSNKSSLNTNINTQNLNVMGINSEPVIKNATQIFEVYKNQAIKFANDQLIDIKKQVVTKIYDEVIKSIVNSKK